DKEGFLRSARSLIQTAGRAARNKNGEVIFYANKITDSMRKAIDETDRRRVKQLAYNEKHNINPETILKTRDEILRSTQFADSRTVEEKSFDKPSDFDLMSSEDQVAFMIKAMKKAAENLDFETATLIRDEITDLKVRIKKSKSKSRR
ncbi:MAG: UvrB/UvrC motif-containing protein, partial [candidate division Zixibacteria bacterium]